MKIKELIKELNKWAPLSYQESYDNSGLLIGSPNNDVSSALISLDINEDVMDQAISESHDVIISHHPIIFQGFKSLTAKTPEERIIMSAIKNDIAIIAMHTNLDNVSHGVNAQIAKILDLENVKVLDLKSGVLKKLVVFVPISKLENLRESLFNAGAGHIGEYDQCSYGTHGIGTFRGGENTNPYVGSKGELHEEKEIRLEVIFTANLQDSITQAIHSNHPYEEPAFDIYTLDNKHPKIGAGVIGELKKEMKSEEFLKYVKKNMQTGCIRHTEIEHKSIKKVALCGGSGSFLIRAAKSANADVFISGDIKYHDFFYANKQFMIADIGHYESEQFTKELIYDFLIEKFPNFAVQISEHQTNPIKYF